TVNILTQPRTLKAGAPARLDFHIEDPKTGKQVREYEIVHEKFFHLFLISQDLKSFAHQHPVEQPDGTFHYEYSFPKPGMYRVVSDFYPKGATPQLIERSLMVTGPGFKLEPARLSPDLSPQHDRNIDV